jgi:hypothetical protein
MQDSGFGVAYEDIRMWCHSSSVAPVSVEEMRDRPMKANAAPNAILSPCAANRNVCWKNSPVVEMGRRVNP